MAAGRSILCCQGPCTVQQGQRRAQRVLQHFSVCRYKNSRRYCLPACRAGLAWQAAEPGCSGSPVGEEPLWVLLHLQAGDLEGYHLLQAGRGGAGRPGRQVAGAGGYGRALWHARARASIAGAGGAAPPQPQAQAQAVASRALPASQTLPHQSPPAATTPGCNHPRQPLGSAVTVHQAHVWLRCKQQVLPLLAPGLLALLVA
jgi:hypothetical protein